MMNQKLLHRRQFVGGSVSGFFAFALRNRLTSLFTSGEINPDWHATAKRCVVLWMEGGPSQLDTFDPKPGQSTGGPVRAINTSVAGIQISEYLPRLAKQMHHLSVIRNLTSKQGEHVRATHYLHTGFEFVPTFPRPSMGSVISNQQPQHDLPKYVSLGSPGFGPAYMGPENAPFSIENLEQATELIRGVQRRSAKLKLLGRLDRQFSNQFSDERIQKRSADVAKIQRLAKTGFASALDVSQLSQADRQRYGNHEFGRHCLIARQLLDLGVNFVEIQMGGWDTHENNFRSVARLCSAIDQPMAALVEDLIASGMYQDTVLIWLGEFGRTPQINGRNGRDHFPRCTPVVIGGGPFASGQAIGSTDRKGLTIESHTYQIADLFATVYSAFGIDPDHEFTTTFGSPTSATDSGRVINELL